MGRHHVLPLSADIQVRARRIGFDSLTPIRWMKVANIKLEASTSSVFLGKPNLPNGVVKNDVESILFLRKPGGSWQIFYCDDDRPVAQADNVDGGLDNEHAPKFTDGGNSIRYWRLKFSY